MLLGPVFQAELIRTPRRRRYYALRVAYGLALLLLVWLNYLSLMEEAQARGGLVWISEVASFALYTFLTFAVAQVLTLLVLVPALFGGVIADEKQRKTMHYLMASRLSSGEIVLDKFLGRMLHVAVFFLLGLPVMSLLGLFGGVPWEYVVVAYAGTASLTFFAATLATLVSTFARRVRQGVVIAYLVLLFWLILPPMADLFCKLVFPRAYPWLEPVNAWILATNPLHVMLLQARGRPPRLWTLSGGPGATAEPFVWMVLLQVAAGVSFLLLAIAQLRPTFRRQETASPRLTWLRADRRRPRWLERPDCGGDAMLWKERYFARTDVFTKLVVLPATILLTVVVVLAGGFDESVARSFQDLVREGYRSGSGARAQLNATLRAVSPLYISLWLLAVAGASASSLTGEREEDTWTSLVSTPLSGWEIIRGKMLGAVWGLRGFGAILALAWLVGLVLGAVHPLGLLLALLVVGVLTWAVASLGLYASLNARSTSRALTATLVALVVLNGGYLVVLDPLLIVLGHERDLAERYFGCTPYLASFTLLSYDHAAWISGEALRKLPGRDPAFVRALALAIFVLSSYALAAVGLTRRSIRRFDAAIDRPERPPPPDIDFEPEDPSRPAMVKDTQ